MERLRDHNGALVRKKNRQTTHERREGRKKRVADHRQTNGCHQCGSVSLIKILFDSSRLKSSMFSPFFFFDPKVIVLLISIFYVIFPIFLYEILYFNKKPL